MRLKNQALSPLQAMLAIFAIIAISLFGYGLFLGVSNFRHRKRVQANIPKYLVALEAQKALLSKIIEKYHAQFGFYPPNHSTNATSRASLNSLYYELVGTRWNTNFHSFGIPTAKETISPETLERFFNMSSFSNAAAYPNWPANFITDAPFAGREQSDIILLVSTPPDEIGLEIVDDFVLSGWRYAADPAEHNQGKFDLWAELDVLNQHFVVNNWETNR